MTLNRRNLLKSGALLSATSLLPSSAQPQAPQDLPKAFQALRPLGDRVKPIAPEEFRARVAKAQKLMTDADPQVSTLYLTPGSSLYYFSGVRWGTSERLLALVIPRAGDPLVVCPAFEEGRLHEQLRWPIEIRVWQEDENPSGIAAKWLAERGMRTGRIAIEETTRYTFFDHLRDAAPNFEYSSGDPLTISCRGQKSGHELELMRLACEATFEVFRAVFASLQTGMSQSDIAALVERGFSRMGLRGGALVLLGEWAALPHGTVKPQKLTEGEVVLIDGGTSVEGYQSDVTRCGVIGKPSDKLLRAFEILRRAQDAALDACCSGKLSGTVDDAARAIVTSAGFGPDYKFFTHRLGHGIGLDGHEHPYLVRGSKTILQPGMTFSNEPGIYVRGDYGVRLEDDMVVTPGGAAQLLTPGFSPSFEKPVG
ncbi:MAG TPA: Xaa-Pro peptidase family protein [Candidatus Acidoferrales bacterium]|nr:Xaa-Pro peptidase family protein [Candidatus Acidoferrales bacterium]